jgi:hypothetical protein
MKTEGDLYGDAGHGSSTILPPKPPASMRA